MNLGALRLIFNLASLAVALSLGLALALAAPSPDGVYFHLAQGRLLASLGAFPPSDPFVFSLPADLAFDPSGWLYALGAWGAQQAFGLKGLGALRLAALLAVLAFLVASAFRRGARPFSSGAFALAALAGSLPFLGWGPETAALACFAFALYLMEGPFWDALFQRWLWLPLLLVPWVNLHASAWLLPGLALAWTLGSRGEPGGSRNSSLALWATLLVLFACAFLHPSPLAPLRSLNFGIDSPFEPARFAESRLALGLLALGLLSLLASAALPSAGAPLGRDLACFLGLALPALLWRPLLPFAACFSAPLAAARFGTVIDALPAPLRRLRWLAKAALLAAALAWLPGMLARGTRDAARGASHPPRETLEFFRDELLGGNLYCEPGWEGLALWKLEGVKVFSDGRRGDGAGWRALIEAAPARGADKAPWEQALQRHHADFALLRPNTPLAKAMARSAHWQPVDFDDASVLYVAVSPERAALIKARAPRGLRPGDRDEPFEPSRLPQVEADLETRRLARPKSGVLYYFTARLWLERGRETLAREWLERGIKSAPAFAPNYQLLGELRLKSGDPQGAQKFLERAAALGGL